MATSRHRTRSTRGQAFSWKLATTTSAERLLLGRSKNTMSLRRSTFCICRLSLQYAGASKNGQLEP